MKKTGAYVAITLLAAVVLLLFQLVGMSLGLFDSDYEINKYASGERVQEQPRAISAEHTVAIVSAGDPEALPAIRDACYYLGYPCTVYNRLTDEALAADWLCWADDTLGLTDDLPRLLAYSASGRTLVFARMPSLTLLRQSEELRRLTGVESIEKASYRTQGMRLYKGFLLGGEMVYTDSQPVVPWMRLYPGARVYIGGYVEDPTAAEPQTLPLCWRTRQTEGFVFVYLQDWLEHADGVGFLYAMLAQTQQTMVYPVVNAQTMMVQNFPYLSTENEELVNRWYHQTSEKLFFNALLPNVTAVFNNCGYPMTCLFSSCFDGATPDWNIKWDSLKLYIRLIVGRSGEMGISAYERGGADRLGKLERDLGKMDELARAYSVTVFAPSGMARAEYEPLLNEGGLLARIRTVVEPLNDHPGRFEFVSPTVLRLPVTQDGYDSSTASSISLHSFETALLCSNVSIDMRNILYPTSEKDDWALLNKHWSDTLVSEWAPFKDLDKLCVSDADIRARAFLNLRWSCEEQDDTLLIRVEDYTSPVYLLLRRQDVQLYSCRNATATKLEDGTYLLTITAPEATVHMRDENELKIH